MIRRLPGAFGCALALVFIVYGPVPSRAPGAAEAPAPSVQESTPDSEVGRPYADPFQQRSQHLARLGVDRWHAAGYRGRGIKIAILDSGFRGYRAHLGQALPAQVTVRSFRTDGNLEARDSQHAVLSLIHI